VHNTYWSGAAIGEYKFSFGAIVVKSGAKIRESRIAV
jgi:hypothetical protein